MIVKMFGRLNHNDETVWIDANIDKHAITAYWSNPTFIEDIEIESDEWVIMLDGNEVVIKEDLNLLAFLQHKFER